MAPYVVNDTGLYELFLNDGLVLLCHIQHQPPLTPTTPSPPCQGGEGVVGE